MSNELNVVEKSGKDIRFSELIYVFCKNIVWILLLVASILAIGFTFAFREKPYYTAYSSVYVDYKLDPDNPNYNDIIATGYVLSTVTDILNSVPFKDYAQKQLRQVEGFEDLTIGSGSLGVSRDEDTAMPSLVIKLSYTDAKPETAQIKLAAIVLSANNYISATTYDGKFSINSLIVGEELSIGGSYEKIAPIVEEGSEKLKIILITSAAAIVAAVALTIALLLFGDKVSSVTKLEKVTGKKNFMVIERKRSRNKIKSEKQEDEELLRLKVNKLSDTLIYLKDDDKNKVYQIQSPASGDGKTTVAVNLAITLGFGERKTLIIDCDFSHPTVHHAFKLSKNVGITDYFKGELDFDGMIKHTSYKNVDIITCGDYIYDHTIFFTSAKFKHIIDTAREKYDFILLDCAPVKALSDYINISPLVDATLLVVKSDRINVRDLKYVVNELQSCNSNLIGTVFNFSATSFGNEYYYYYHRNKNAEVYTIAEEMAENEKTKIAGKTDSAE